MPIDKKVRKEVTDLVVKICNTLDHTKKNGEYYQAFFDSMSDDEFKKWLKKFAENEDQYIILQMQAFNKDSEPNLDRMEEAAKILGIELDEYVEMPFLNPQGKPIRTQYKVPVGYLHMKRMQQMLSKKNVFSINTSQRNMKTNTVTSDSKSGRVSDAETFALVANNAEYSLREFLGPRADDSLMKQQMMKQISTQGYASIKEMDSDTKNKQTINTIDVYFLGAGIMTDLLTPGYAMRRTLDSKQVKMRERQ